MEAIAAFGVAVNVIQLVDFGSKLISSGRELNKSARGQLIEHSELEATTASLSRLTNKVHGVLQSLEQDRELTEHEREIAQLGHDCARVASELLEALESLKASGKRRRWGSFRLALLTVWHQDQIETLERRLNRFRQELVANILATLRLELQAANEQQSTVLYKVQEIENSTKTIGQNFLGHIDDSRRWRDDIVDAIHKNTWQSQRSRDTVKRLAGESSDERAKREEVLRIALLDRLRFSDMSDREERISEAHKQTFEWIYRDLDVDNRIGTSFAGWLAKKEKGLYWVTGKAGSGKSTLMKYLYNDNRTFNPLNTWASPGRLITAAFFFWNSGSNMQMSMMGLLQSLLYQALSELPLSIPKVFPERWEVYCLFGEDTYPWSWRELVNALKLLILESDVDKKFFFIIDGLDEFDGDIVALADLLLDLVAAAPNLKICAASRPWVSFEEAFKGRPSLMLQELTHPDIQLYVNTKFRNNTGFIELEEQEPKYAGKLLNEIATKAEGVFLWVHLVVQSLITGLTNGDRVSDLQRRLDQLPPNLEDLFRKMLDSLDPFYLEHASQLFQLVRASIVSPTVLCLSLADEEDPEYVLRTEVKAFTDLEKLSKCKSMKRRLNSRCKGLLEVASPKLSNHKLDPNLGKGKTAGAESLDDENSDPISHQQIADQKVQYLHRTVKDFLETPSVWDWIVKANHKSFDPYVSLCRAYLLLLKGQDPTSLDVENFWDVITWCIEYAANAEATTGEVQVRLLDELDRAANKLAVQPRRDGQTFLEIFGSHEVDSNRHWTCTLLTWTSGTSFLYFAAMCDLHGYLEARLSSDYFKETEGERTPLLLAAMSDHEFLSRYTQKPFCSRLAPRLDTIRTLLRKGADPKQPYRGQSPWSIAVSTVRRDHGVKSWNEILKLFINHGTDETKASDASVMALPFQPSAVLDVRDKRESHLAKLEKHPLKSRLRRFVHRMVRVKSKQTANAGSPQAPENAPELPDKILPPNFEYQGNFLIEPMTSQRDQLGRVSHRPSSVLADWGSA